MTEPVRVGVIGCGAIFAQYAQAAARLPILRIAAAADLDEARAAATEVTRRFHAPATVEALSALLAERPEARIVAGAGWQDGCVQQAGEPVAQRHVELDGRADRLGAGRRRLVPQPAGGALRT